MKNKVILVSARSLELAGKLRLVLEQAFFNVTDTCVSGSETLRKVRMYQPDLLIVDYDLGDMTAAYREVARRPQNHQAILVDTADFVEVSQ